ncbi:hypothetical protein TWF481_006247 [Arthrobotrys musiformis]|uniref:Uncharacterized protein n=1 Tax=Arthrobotrys musiformis TaxID=47236 RepID=A0AAV9WH46_9PEZI
MDTRETLSDGDGNGSLFQAQAVVKPVGFHFSRFNSQENLDNFSIAIGLVSLMVERDPLCFTALQISSTNFLAFVSHYPRSVFQPKEGIIYRNVLQAMNREDRKAYFDSNALFKPIFSCMENLETLILEAPSNYYYRNDDWWYQDMGEAEMIGGKSPGTVFYPLERLYQRLSTIPRLTTVHIALPVQQGVFLADDADILNMIMKAVPNLKALTISEVPPRTSCDLEKVDFTTAPYLQSLEILCLKTPSSGDESWKSLYPNAVGFEVTTPATVNISKISANLKKFSFQRDFNVLNIRLLVGNEILGSGVSQDEFWWNTVRKLHSWKTGPARNVVYSSEEFCHVWDPFHQYPCFPENNYSDMFQLDDLYIL